jgi:uncharacterized membrane protein YgcG
MPQRIVIGLLALMLGLVLAGSAQAVYPPPLKDDGKFFSKDTIDKANKKIRELYEKYKKDVLVETLMTLSVDQEKALKEEGTEKFFSKLALARAREVGLNGVLILLSKKPSYLRIHMDPDTQKSAFTTQNRKVVVNKMVARFKEDNFDEGLLEGLNAIEAALKSNSGATPRLPLK